MTERYVHDQKAGNFHDVWKHFVLSEYIKLRGTISPLTYIDTHAGSLAYRNTRQDQLLTGILNFSNGISDLPSSFYREVLQSFGSKIEYDEQKKEYALFYPGSLMIATYGLKETGSKVIGCEINDELANKCIRNMTLVKNALKTPIEFKCVNADGYQFAGQYINDNETDQGVVFVDPPYYPDEQVDWNKCNKVLESVISNHNWTYVLWYCIYSTDPSSHYGLYSSFKEKLSKQSFSSVDFQLQITPLTQNYSKSVTGILIMNPVVSVDDFVLSMYRSGVLKVAQLLKPKGSEWGPKVNLEIMGG